MNCERHAASTELCLTISQFAIPLWKILATPLTQETSLRITRFEKKNQEEKKEEERITKKATDTNQQLYQKNYRSGPKDKCSETKKRKN